MYYHFAILLLFRPLIKLRIIGSSIMPRDVCSQAADAISSLLRSYSQLYTLRRTPSFVPYFVLTSSIMHLAIGATFSDTTSSAAESESAQGGQSPRPSYGRPLATPKLSPHVAEAITRGIADLTEMAPCHFFAEQALNILRYLAGKWNLDVDIKPMGKEEGGPPENNPDPEPTTRSVTSSLNVLVPNVAESDFDGSSGPQNARSMLESEGEIGARAKTIQQKADAMENPLFWPFPIQERPMLPTGEELEKAGFEVF